MIFLICENNLKINDDVANEFTKYMVKYPYLYEDLAYTISDEIKKNAINPIILDLGSGPGLINKEIKKLLQDSIILSLDSSIKMLKNAEKCSYNVFAKQINGILSLSEKIPIKSNSVDIVVSRFSLSYWKNPEKAIFEINRILKPEGKFILEALNKNFPKWKLLLIKIHMYLKSAGTNVVRYHIDAYKNAYNFNQVKILLNSSGFKINKKEFNKRDWKIKIIASKKILK